MMVPRLIMLMRNALECVIFPKEKKICYTPISIKPKVPLSEARNLFLSAIVRFSSLNQPANYLLGQTVKVH